MKIVKQNKPLNYFQLLIWLVIIFYSFHFLLTSSFVQPILGPLITSIFPFFCCVLAFVEIKKIRLDYLIKFEEDGIRYNDYRKNEQKVIDYKKIESVDYTYDNKYLKIKIKQNSEIKEEDILIIKGDFKSDISKVITTFHEHLRKLNDNSSLK